MSIRHEKDGVGSHSTDQNAQLKEDNKKEKKAAKETTGESLEELTDQEWETGAIAMPAELLNVEKKPNTVNVFVGPGERGETILQQAARTPLGERVKDQKDPIQQLVNNILHKICDDRRHSQPVVDVHLRDRSGREQAIQSED
ncbi:hypothetical protein ANCCEY_09203 [Ancylostoma ceylanicum]|uniref:Uncharacterized protein n=1 Tax=Ancylostoma ceylanicum TaxID=53326 RepID=A0A0D6LKM7_9BILA|nr:hypothetical protein ANCCEY_09203 [Ancylostoma ceylanicum]